MFGDALSTPAKTSDSAVTLFIGGVLTLLAVLGPLATVASLSVSPLALLLVPLALLPGLVLRGYYVAVIAGGANREPGAPSIVRWGTLVSNGVKSVLVSVGYLLPAVLLVVLALGALVALVPPEVADPGTSPAAVESSTSDARALAVLAVFVLGGLLLLGYALLYAYVRPAALAVFAVSGSLREAFRLGRVRSVAGTGDFAVGWLLAGLVLVVGGLFALPLSALLVGFFLLFYLQVVAHSLYGRAASDVLVPEPGSVGTDEHDAETTADGENDNQRDGETAAESDAGASADDAGFPSEWAEASVDDDIDESDDNDETDESDDTNETDESDDTNETDESDDTNETDETDDTNESDETDDTNESDETDDTNESDESRADSLTDWDDVSDAVESSTRDDSPPETAVGGVSAAVQSGRGVPVADPGAHGDDSKTDNGRDVETADSDAETADSDAETANSDAETADSDPDADDSTDSDADDPFDWGPVDDR